VQSKKDAIARLKGASSELRSLGVKNIGIFGSFVTGQNTEKSDIDILVDFAPGKHSFDNFMELSFLLEDLFGCKVELLTSESLSTHIGPFIMREVEHVPIPA
jgi:predicted nucleotidyltransferase